MIFWEPLQIAHLKQSWLRHHCGKRNSGSGLTGTLSPGGRNEVHLRSLGFGWKRHLEAKPHSNKKVPTVINIHLHWQTLEGKPLAHIRFAAKTGGKAMESRAEAITNKAITNIFTTTGENHQSTNSRIPITAL